MGNLIIHNDEAVAQITGIKISQNGTVVKQITPDLPIGPQGSISIPLPPGGYTVEVTFSPPPNLVGNIEKESRVIQMENEDKHEHFTISPR
jgi:hypothetical protein